MTFPWTPSSSRVLHLAFLTDQDKEKEDEDDSDLLLLTPVVGGGKDAVTSVKLQQSSVLACR